jgi:hypothetical protein
MDRFEEIYRNHVQELSDTRRAADLVYFYQFRQIHLETLAEGNYRETLALFEGLQEHPELSLFATYGVNLIEWLEKEQDSIRQIELKIQLDGFITFFLEVGARVREQAAQRETDSPQQA